MKNIFRVFIILVLFVNTINAQESTYRVRVEGTCGMCQERIEKNAIEKGGAISASWDVETSILTVLIEESTTTIMGIKWELAQIGHDSHGFTASDEVYNNLHSCCKYREESNHSNLENHENQNDKIETNGHEHVHSAMGYVYGYEGDEKIPLIGANVTLVGSGEGTSTNLDGYFELDNSELHADEIEISYIGYETQYIALKDEKMMDIILPNGHKLETVEVTYRARTTEISFLKPLNVENITREELCKAACCNLSESFETNPSVDVSFSDAVTGARMIQLLGLSGPNVQITRELIPDVRAMSSVYGLSMTPGPWIESIQLIKGVGSVVNGFEAISGQINVELKKPEAGDLLFLNGYVNNGGRYEVNANARTQISKNVRTGILLHSKRMNNAHDNNNDGFTDMPLENDFVVANRWKFMRKKSIQGQFGVKVSSLTHKGGYHNHFDGSETNHQDHWRMNSQTRRYEAWSKIGYVNDDNPENSVGLQLSAVRQEQESEFGFQAYDTKQNSMYANLVFQRIPNDNVIIRTGFSYQLDDVFEFVEKAANVYNRYESVPGAYFEFNYKKDDKFSIIPGLRADLHNNYGVFITPRLHMKYNYADKGIIRFVGGKGWRTANIFAENLGIYSSARSIVVQEVNEENPYGLDAEEAWNYGINFTQALGLGEKEMIISADFYRTEFENQIVVDFEDPRKVSFYNLDGKSFSNSFQVKVEYTPIENLDLRIAYRMFDVKTDYATGLLQKPMVGKHRAFINAAYKTNSDWHFDATVNWNGSKRLPNSSANPSQYQWEANSPSYFLVNAQIMKRWGDKWDVYLGAENLLNYKQPNAIIASDDTFGSYFDASIVWAPLFGSNIYLGFRYTLTE